LIYNRTVKTKRVFAVSKPASNGKGGRAVPPGGEELKARIVQTAREKFLSFGFSRVTTGEIAVGLGISKATLYKHFGSKEEILSEVVGSIKAEILAKVDLILGDGSIAFLDKVARLMLHMGHWFSRVGPVLIKDLHRHAPEVWEEIEAFRTQKILMNLRNLLETGVREGDVRSDVDLDLVVQMYLALVQKFIRPETLLGSRYSALFMLETLFKVFFGGILTAPARDAFSARGTGFDYLTREVTQ
jgi:AcrR family transcriptional regulator